MRRAIVFACLLALTAPAHAQVLNASAGPITNQASRDATLLRVRAGSSCANCDLFQADLAYQTIAGRDFSGARLRQSEMSIVTADRARFRGANLSLANMFGGRFSSADFTNANLEQANFVGAFLGGARFTGAVMTGANLSGAEMADAVGLTQAQLSTACGDATTTLPSGLTVPRCQP